MTNYLEVKYNRPRRGCNQKDWGSGSERPNDLSVFRGQTWTDLGFAQETATTYTYTWDLAHCPTWRIAPSRAGLVARWRDEEIAFPYSTRPADIKARLDDEILEAFRLEAELAEAPIDWDAMEADGTLIDVDEFMGVGNAW